MQTPPRETIILYFGTIVFWIALAGTFWTLGQHWARASRWGEHMRDQWRQSLLITIVYLLSEFLRGRGFNVYGFAIFCQAWIGLALAKGIPDFEPLPVIESFFQRKDMAKTFALFLLFGVLAGAFGMIAGGLAMGFSQNAFHEVNITEKIMQEFPASKFQAFFIFLAGGGIAEELVHRLVLLSLVWALTKRPWFAILVSAVIHSAYHFTPFNLLYLHFLQFPISQFVSGVVMGILWGYVFIKRGFETAAFGHTLSDWLPLLLFT